MSQPPRPRGLGRGLSALLGDDEVAATVAPPAASSPPSAPQPAPIPPPRAPLSLPIGQLRAGRMQPRTTFDDVEVLVESVKEFGLLQPILVRPIPGQTDSYEIVAGERRWRAAQKAQLHEVPVVVRNMGDLDALQVGLIENLQRTDLTAIDEAQGYRRLVEDFAQSHDDIARTMGKSRSQVANTVRLLDLPPPVQEMIKTGDLTAGQARALIGTPDPLALAQRAVQEKLSARDLERMASVLKPRTKSGRAKATSSKGADTLALEKRIEEALGLKADLKLRGLGEQSLLTLEIRDFDQLDTVVERLTRR